MNMLKANRMLQIKAMHFLFVLLFMFKTITSYHFELPSYKQGSFCFKTSCGKILSTKSLVRTYQFSLTISRLIPVQVFCLCRYPDEFLRNVMITKFLLFWPYKNSQSQLTCWPSELCICTSPSFLHVMAQFPTTILAAEGWDMIG